MTGKRRRAAKEAEAVPGLKLYAQLGLRLPGELALRLKAFCVESGKSLNAVATEALGEYLDRRRK
jgi:predicted HicB family RNase H-like nuclease